MKCKKCGKTMKNNQKSYMLEASLITFSFILILVALFSDTLAVQLLAIFLTFVNIFVAIISFIIKICSKPAKTLRTTTLQTASIPNQEQIIIFPNNKASDTSTTSLSPNTHNLNNTLPQMPGFTQINSPTFEKDCFVSISIKEKANIIRKFKGKSLIDFPDNFTVIDIETTGLSSQWDEIIEISALKCENWSIVKDYTTLIKPVNPIDEYITTLTGITNEMLKNERSIEDVLPEFFSFIGNDILIAHNANFDINFLYDNAILTGQMLTNDFVDTMRISRLLRRDEPHHRLKDLCIRYNIKNNNAHRALSDCNATFKCFQCLKDEFFERSDSVSSIILRHPLKASDIIPENIEPDKDNALYGKTCVFTGTLEKMTHKEAMQIVVNIGGFVGDSVTKKTNYLILGNKDYCTQIKDRKSSKHKKAEKLKLEGFDIEILPENVFYDLINSD